MTACTLEDWKDTSETESYYTAAEGYKWLCPNQSTTTIIGGKWTIGGEKLIMI